MCSCCSLEGVWQEERARAVVRRAAVKPKLGYLLVVSSEDNDRECFPFVIATAGNKAREHSYQRMLRHSLVGWPGLKHFH